jgi:hypothetical protein
MRILADGPKEATRGMRFRIAYDGDADTEALCYGAFGDSVGSVVGALGMNVWAERFEKALDVGIGKKDYKIDGAKRSDQLSASLFIENGAAGALQLSDAGIGIDSDDEEIALLLCTIEIAHMANVERVKAAVGEDDALPCRLGIGDEEFESVDGADF